MPLSDQQIQEFRTVFDFFDKNQSNTISSNEIGELLRGVGQNPTNAEIKSMIAEIDSNGNGTIEFNEFLKHMENKPLNTPEEAEEEIREAFKVFDRDGNGYVTMNELKDTLKSIGETMTDEEVEDMMRAADADSDGRVNYNEFARIICAK